MSKFAMIVGSSFKTFHICPSTVHRFPASISNKDEPIPNYYSYKQAYDAGWRLTTDRLFSKDGNEVWVCPDCAKKYKWTQLWTHYY